MSGLQRKYEQAKKIIHELKRHEQFLAVQLQERDHEYHSHLRLLKERVLQLEDELATTQKFAGIPVKLPYEKGAAYNGGQLSPPDLLKQPPVSLYFYLEGEYPYLKKMNVHKGVSFKINHDFFQIIPEDIVQRLSGGDISDTDDSLDPSEMLDRAVPFHTLLDISANKSKAELAHKGTMSLRSRPSSEALRSAVMRRSVSAASNFSSATNSFQTVSCDNYFVAISKVMSLH